MNRYRSRKGSQVIEERYLRTFLWVNWYGRKAWGLKDDRNLWFDLRRVT